MIPQDIKLAFQEVFGNRVSFNTPLAPFVAYGIGGPADILVFPNSENELDWLKDVSQRSSLPITIIGTGTNLLVRDGGIRGITVSLLQGFKDIQIMGPQTEEILVTVGGGVSKPSLLEWAIGQGFSGLEFSAGVPGTIGGGIFMNAGTKYGSYGDILKEIRIYDFLHGAQTRSRDQLFFGYRESAVKDSLVLSVLFQLRRGEKENIRKEVDRIIKERAEKQPLDFPSCGSTFKNPTGYSAGRLIEKSGLKGTRRGNAEISLKHANFFLNLGGATASDVLELITLTQETVLKMFGVVLECEVIVVGEHEKSKI